MKRGKTTVGINQRLPFDLAESAFLRLSESGNLNREEIIEEAGKYFSGENRQDKTFQLVRRIANEMHELETRGFYYFSEFRKSGFQNRKVLFIAACTLTYPIFYDTLCILGSVYTIQQEIAVRTLLEKLSVKYGSNKSVENGLSAIIPMLIECGLLVRSSISIYRLGTPFVVTDASIINLLIYIDIISSNLSSVVKEDIPFRPFLKFFPFELNQATFGVLISLEESRSGGGYVIPRKSEKRSNKKTK